MEKYLLIYLISTLLALIITPLIIYIARKFNVMDRPDVRRVHNKPVPRIGGIAIFIPTMAVILYMFFLDGIGPIGEYSDQKDSGIVYCSYIYFFCRDSLTTSGI